VLALGVVGVAKADNRNVLGSDSRLHAGHVGQRAVTMTKQVREGHAVHVARLRAARRVQVGVRVNPDHTDALAACGMKRGRARDRTGRQRVIAA
jgi:hypothetical protein